MFRTLTVAAAAGALTLASLGAVSPAFAASETAPTPAPKINKQSTLAQIQAAGATQTADRITSLNTAVGKITATTKLTSSDRATILGTLNADLSAMQGLQSKIAADTDVATAAADYRDIFTGYRVYAVALPQSYIAASADGLTGTAIPRLQSAATKIAAAFAANPSKVTPAMQAQLTDMQAKTADAASKTSGVAAAALAVTPAAYNANHSILVQDRANTKTAIADAKAATQDGKAILAALK